MMRILILEARSSTMSVSGEEISSNFLFINIKELLKATQAQKDLKNVDPQKENKICCSNHSDFDILAQPS